MLNEYKESRRQSTSTVYYEGEHNQSRHAKRKEKYPNKVSKVRFINHTTFHPHSVQRNKAPACSMPVLCLSESCFPSHTQFSPVTALNQAVIFEIHSGMVIYRL